MNRLRALSSTLFVKYDDYMQFKIKNKNRMIFCIVCSFVQISLIIFLILDFFTFKISKQDIEKIFILVVLIALKIAVDVPVFWLMIRNLIFFMKKYIETRGESRELKYWKWFIGGSVIFYILTSLL